MLFGYALSLDVKNVKIAVKNNDHSQETRDFIAMLEKTMETISGVNAVARGNPDPNLRSGNALALIQSMTLQFMSGLQQSYVAMIEDVGTGIIDILKVTYQHLCLFFFSL